MGGIAKGLETRCGRSAMQMQKKMPSDGLIMNTHLLLLLLSSPYLFFFHLNTIRWSPYFAISFAVSLTMVQTLPFLVRALLLSPVLGTTDVEMETLTGNAISKFFRLIYSFRNRYGSENTSV